jgi:DNA invertase Pin-like site-specific DNA recombinase
MPFVNNSAQETAMRKMIQGVLLHMAEFETEQRKFRQQEGIKRAKEAGRYKGRKSKLTPELLKRVEELLSIKQLKIYEVARTLNLSQTTLRKAVLILEKKEKERTQKKFEEQALIIKNLQEELEKRKG